MSIGSTADFMTHEEKRVLRSLVERTLGDMPQAGFSKRLDASVLIAAATNGGLIIITI